MPDLVRDTAEIRARWSWRERHHEIGAVRLALLTDYARLPYFVKQVSSFPVFLFRIELDDTDDPQTHAGTAVPVDTVRQRHYMMDARRRFAIVQFGKGWRVERKYADGGRPKPGFGVVGVGARRTLVQVGDAIAIRVGKKVQIADLKLPGSVPPPPP